MQRIIICDFTFRQHARTTVLTWYYHWQRYCCAPDADSSTFWSQISSPFNPSASSSAFWSSTSEIEQSSVLHFGSLVVTPSVQRLLSGVLLVPAIMSSVWYTPHEALMLLGSIATTVGSYEFAWLAFRIVRRVEVLFKYYEGGTSAVNDDQRSIHLSRASREEEDSIFPSTIVDPQQCVLAPIAEVLFYRGNQWLAALVLALPTSMIFIGIDSKILKLVRPTDQKLETFVWAYLIPTRYVIALCGWFAPSWTWTILVWWQSEVFSVMALMVQTCPIAIFTCSDNANSNYLTTVFAVGYTVILLFCVLTSSEQVLVVQATLAVTGFLLVQGLGLTIISLLDINNLDQSRDLFVLLLTITWTSQTSAYIWKRLAAPGWGHSTPVFSRLSTQFDMESLIVAIGVGVCITILTLHFNSLPGDYAGVYALLASMGVGCMHIGELVIELWARAAGVRHTGSSLPGNCGLLERTTTLVFVIIVFLPYLAVQS